MRSLNKIDAKISSNKQTKLHSQISLGDSGKHFSEPQLERTEHASSTGLERPWFTVASSNPTSRCGSALFSPLELEAKGNQ